MEAFAIHKLQCGVRGRSSRARRRIWRGPCYIKIFRAATGNRQARTFDSIKCLRCVRDVCMVHECVSSLPPTPPLPRPSFYLAAQSQTNLPLRSTLALALVCFPAPGTLCGIGLLLTSLALAASAACCLL